MTATTRAASMTPASSRSTRPDASLTLLIGTLRTSMGSGTAATSPSGFHDRTGAAGHGVSDSVQGCDHGPQAAGLDEPAGRLDLRTHRSGRELAGGRMGAQVGDAHRADRADPRG